VHARQGASSVKTIRERGRDPQGSGRGDSYDAILSDIVRLLDEGRRTTARAVNRVMTATYWAVGRRIVEHEQGGLARADYGDTVLERLAVDLTARLGRGFSRQNLQRFRQFYLTFPLRQIRSTVSSKFIGPAALPDLACAFPLPWSHYVLLMGRSRSPEALDFYRNEAERGGWSVRQLARQIDSQFYERTALSRNKAAMLKKGQVARPEDRITAEEEIRNPLVLEFLDLKDEYSESDLEEALVHHLEHFLMELGNDFAFVGRQRRLRIDDEWYHVDLLFFHRRLR
jgi:predicted nuclease of restriction endonuclease-like (RecB) superfamily